MALHYRREVATGRLEETIDPDTIEQRLNQITRVLEERTEMVRDTFPRAADSDRYLTAPVFDEDPFEINPDAGLKEDVDEVFTTLRVAIAPKELLPPAQDN